MPADITNLKFLIVFILASPIFSLWFHNKLQNISNNYMHTKAVKGVNLFLCVIVKSNCRVKSELFAVLQLEIWYGIRNTSSEPFSSWLLQQSCISVGIATSQVKQKKLYCLRVYNNHLPIYNLCHILWLVLADSNFMWEKPYNGQVRLVTDTLAPSSGRVEVHQGNKWGTVCARDFGEAAADSVCRQLGYTGSAAISVASRYPITPSSSPVPSRSFCHILYVCDKNGEMKWRGG